MLYRREPQQPARVRDLRYWLRVASLAAAYYAAARIGLVGTPSHIKAMAFWPSAGIALAALVLYGREMWPGVLVGAILASAGTGATLGAASAGVAANTLHALAGEQLLRWRRSAPANLSHMGDVVRFAVLAAGVSTALCAGIGATSVWLMDGSPWRELVPVWLEWCRGTATGVVVFAPLAFTWVGSQRPPRERYAEGLLLFLIVAVTTNFLYSHNLPWNAAAMQQKAMLFPLVIWAALRFGPFGTATVVAVMATIAIWHVSHGSTAVIGETTEIRLAVTQLFMATMSATTIVFAAAVAERDHAAAALRRSEARYRFLAEAMPQIVWSARADGSIDYLNGRWFEYAGIGMGESSRSDNLYYVHADERDNAERAWTAALASGEPTESEVRLRAADGTYRWHLARGVPHRGPDGAILGWVGTCTDIHDLKVARQELARREQQLATITDHVPDLLARLNRYGRCQFVNPAMARAAGLSREAFAGKTLRELRLPRDLCNVWERACGDLIATGDEQRFAFSLKSAGGKSHYQCRMVPELGEDGRVEAIVAVAHDVTELMRIELEQQKFVALVQESPDFIGICTLDGQPLFLNDAGLRMIGCDLKDSLAVRHVANVHGPSAEFLRDVVFPQVLRTDRWEGETVVCHRVTGETTPVHQTVFLVRDVASRKPLCIATVARVIARQKLFEAEREHLIETLWAERNRLETVLEQMPAGVLIKEAASDALVCNDRAEDILLHPSLGTDGLALTDSWMLWRPGGTPYTREQIPVNRAVRLGEVVTSEEIEIRRADGTRTLIRANAAPVFDRWRSIVAAVMTFHDVTSEKEAEQELVTAKQVAEEATRARGRFLANMSHELRTPLNSIIGFSEMLEDQLAGELNEKQTRYVAHIRSSGQHLLALINDILDLSKIDAGKVTLDLTEFCPSRVIGQIKEVISPLAARKNIEVELVASGDVPAIVADESKFKQIVYNLLSNAVKFTPDAGRVEVRIETDALASPGSRHYRSRRPTAADAVRVTVRDNGVGIKPADHQRVFEQFEQVDDSYARAQQGTGLGLALTRRLVELHGGRIWLESEGTEGKGSVFAFVLPIRAEAGSATPAAAA